MALLLKEYCKSIDNYFKYGNIKKSLKEGFLHIYD